MLLGLSPGLSGEFIFGFVNFRWWPVEDTIDWYSRQELLHYMSVYGLFVMSSVCCVVDIVMGGMNFDYIADLVLRFS